MKLCIAAGPFASTVTSHLAHCDWLVVVWKLTGGGHPSRTHGANERLGICEEMLFGGKGAIRLIRQLKILLSSYHLCVKCKLSSFLYVSSNRNAKENFIKHPPALPSMDSSSRLERDGPAYGDCKKMLDHR